jgi:hypothetical protein
MTAANEDPFENDEVDSGDPFSSPPSGERITKFVGQLLFIEALRYNTGIQTRFGEKDGVDVNVTVIDKNGKGTTYEEVGILQSALVGKLKNKVGAKPMLGRLYKRPTDKGNDAYDLEQPSETDKEAARTWWKSQQGK